ncbi:arginine--tRNA ligase [Streptomyces sp. SID3343]|uniref:arginine--tRNA ligase n=1 Tax=Streptomyces sp. SID3343 TaxID=2690260 RepID=UPI0013711053|nr:arginine--tRNA ligase [Streptomyces sp. SID3343]
MTPAELSQSVLSAVRAAVEAGELAVVVPESTTVERPKNREHGDYATNIALQLAKPAKRPPREIAELLAARIAATPGIAKVDVAGPGFLNITFDTATQGELARTIVEAGAAYGGNDALDGLKINLEFVSANPTGPIHIGGVRWAAVGDSLGRILRASGADVTTEYYINDAGVQIDKFGKSLMAAANERPVPDDGYVGAYINDIAKDILAERPDVLGLDEAEQEKVFRDTGLRLMVAEIQRSMENFGAHFDVWFSETSLHASGAVEKAIERLREQGHVYDDKGAIWLRTTDYGDDKDRVLIKSDGEKTYFASDAAYYLNKRDRGNEVCVYMLGADHHGYVGRLKAIVACAGDDPERNIEVIVGQFVKMMRAGEEVRMSKRAGNIITIDDVVEWIGVDAARYSLARSSTDSTITLDIDILTSQKNENPVFYVQYVHARTAGIAIKAADRGIVKGELKPELLATEWESDLLGILGEFPRVVAKSAELREPHHVARYLEQVAGRYHRFYENCQILPKGDDEITDVNHARMWLVEATKTVVANGLGLLGVSAPERM